MFNGQMEYLKSKFNIYFQKNHKINLLYVGNILEKLIETAYNMI